MAPIPGTCEQKALDMRTLICGSLAYDTIMVFKDRFKNHLLPDQLHILNVAFLVPDMRREFGGCAGNIAYGMKLLGADPVIMATVGDDFEPYSARLRALGLLSPYVKPIRGTYTAQAFITTDLDDNQMTAFHPGAMNHSHENDAALADAALAIIAPDGREGMLAHARQLSARGIPFMFDPGQGLPMFNGEELMAFIRRAAYVTVNDYEARLLQERTGEKIEDLARNVKAFIVTLGGKGSVIYHDGREIVIPCAQAEQVLDPTGCGDAYRAGLLYGIGRELDWEVTGRIASLMGAIKVARRGAQNHTTDPDGLRHAFRNHFGFDMD